MSSPVFDAMLESGMKEQEEKIIDVTVASKEDFDLFYGLLQPGAGLVGKQKIVEKNVDALLTLASYYQVSFLQQACEEALLGLPVSVQRLLQAKEHGLARQQSRCIGRLAWSCTKEDLKMIHEASPDLVLRLAYDLHYQLICARRLRLLRSFCSESHALRPAGTSHSWQPGGFRVLAAQQAEDLTVSPLLQFPNRAGVSQRLPVPHRAKGAKTEDRGCSEVTSPKHGVNLRYQSWKMSADEVGALTRSRVVRGERCDTTQIKGVGGCASLHPSVRLRLVIAMAGGHEVPLYGGALTCELPRTLTDASAFREVPDHQEVWVDTSSDRTIVIEILEAKDANGGALSLAGDDDEEADKKERSFLIRKPC
eukprot:s5977_g2.t1